MIKVRKGLPGGRYRPLKDQDVEKIHETSLMRVFAEVGAQA
jgi:trimethylamine:corrinoid methyltransferase-like protein